MIAIPQLSPSWRQALSALALLLAAIGLAFGPTFTAMVAIWERSETFAHAFVVPPISLWLIWRQRELLLAQHPQPSPAFLMAMLGAAAGWLLGELASVNAVTQLGAVAMVVLAVPSVLGVAVARLILFPLSFLFFAVPIGEFLMPQLIDRTADFTVMALRLSGIPVFREGTQFIIPSGHWSVVEACSGIRYLLASMMVGTLFGYLNFRSLHRRLLFLLVSIVVPLVANWFRAYLIVLLGHLSGNKLATGVDHLVYGWLFFGVVMVVTFMIGARWAESRSPASASAVPVASAQVPPGRVSGPWAVALTAAVLSFLPQLAVTAVTAADLPGTPRLQQIEPATGWTPVDAGVTWAPDFKRPSARLAQAFAKDGGQVGLHIAYYRRQDADRKLVSSNNLLVPNSSADWAFVSSRVLRTPIAGGASLAVNAAELRGSPLVEAAAPGRLIVWQIYWVGGRWTQNAGLAKVYGAWYRLMGHGDDGASVFFYAEKDAGGAAEPLLATFVGQNLNLIDALLRRVQGNL